MFLGLSVHELDFSAKKISSYCRGGVGEPRRK